MEMEDREPLLKRLCVALAIHLASYLVFHLSDDSQTRDGTGTEHKPSLVEAICPCRGHSDGLLALQNEGSPVNIIHGTPPVVATVDRASITERSPTIAPDEEEHKAVDEEAVQEPNGYSSTVKSEDDAEIVRLRSLVQSLLDRNTILETKMLEYYGLKEQESAVREIEDRLKIKSEEAKCLSLQIESLKEENQRLKLQASESSTLIRELESARMKGEDPSVLVQAREKIASLEKSISVLLDMERKNAMDEAEAHSKLNRFGELEEEAAQLRREKLVLAQENLDLARRLKSSASEDPDQLGILEEVSQLREANEELKKKIEQLKTDRCADVEELVYLRWLNACLRYEQRDHQPPPGTIIAKDLSKRSSPKSEEKVKQLVLHYGYPGLDDHDEEEEYSWSDEEFHEEHDPFDDSFLVKHKNPGKSKFLGKLKKLITRKSSKNSNEVASVYPSPVRRASISTFSIDEEMRRSSFDSIASCVTEEDSWTKAEPCANATKKKRASWFRGAYRSPPQIGSGKRRVRVEKEGIVARCKSDLGASYNCRRVRGEDSTINQTGSFHRGQGKAENVQINKYAGALLCSRARPEL